jgi:hypothetical protein
MFRVLRRLSGLQNPKRSQCFEFKKMCIAEYLSMAVLSSDSVKVRSSRMLSSRIKTGGI